MNLDRRFGLALAMCLALAVAATAAAISWSSDQPSLHLDDLLQIEAVPDGAALSHEEHLGWTFEIFGGERRWTEADLAERFTPSFSSGFDIDTLNDGLDQLFADMGTVRFNRVTQRELSSIRALGVAENGAPVTIWISVTDSGQIESLALDEVQSPPRMPPWQSTLVVLAGWMFVAATVMSRRYGTAAQTAILLAASLLALSAMLVLADSTFAYTAGRVLPFGLVPAAVWLLAPPSLTRAGWSLSVAGLSALLGALAITTRDPALIAHPAALVELADNESVLRFLLALSAAAACIALLATAATNVAAVRSTVRRRRPHRWGAAGLTVVWAIAEFASAIDLTAGNAEWTVGPLAAVQWSAVALVPALVVIGLASTPWDRPELARLVIDLEADGANLQSAVAAALEDPTLRVLTSSNGVTITDDDGTVAAEDLPPTKVLTEIRAGDRLVGGLVHDSALQHDPERLEAVAAAAGMALEVSRLNEQVNAQLAEVNASRSRIVQAADIARRRMERDLHDGAQQRLVAIGLRLQRAKRHAETGSTGDLLDLLDSTTADVRGTISDIRALSRGAQPALLAERGLASAVDALAERTPVPVNINVDGERLPERIESTAYYVIAEGLTNVAKHSLSTTAAVSVSRANGKVRIRIEDDGTGGAHQTAGSGLEGLDDRVAAAGGTFELISTRAGTTLEVTIPCE